MFDITGIRVNGELGTGEEKEIELNGEIDPETKNDLIKHIRERAAIKEMKDEATRREKKVNKKLEPILRAHGLKKVAITGLGMILLVEAERTTLDRGKFKELLLLKGVPATVIVESERDALRTSSYTSITYRK